MTGSGRASSLLPVVLPNVVFHTDLDVFPFFFVSFFYLWVVWIELCITIMNFMYDYNNCLIVY